MQRLVPTLRFTEFLDAEEWNEIKFIDVKNKKTKWSFIGGPFGSNLKSSDYVTEGVRIIQLQNIGDAEFIDNYKIFTSEAKANELLSNNIYPGDIILSKMGDPVGRACLIPSIHSRYVMCSDGIRLVVNEELFNKYFIYIFINSIQFRTLIEKTATGSTRKRIGLDDLKNLPIIVPNLPEQQKIANCLSSIDKLIDAQTQNVNALKTHKKGLMQRLFPAEGEAAPKQRFLEFQNAGEWDREPLGSLSQILRGGSPRPIESFVTTDVDGLNWLKIGDVYSESKYITKTQKKVIKEALSKTREVHPGDLILSNSMSFGRPYILRIKSCIHDGWIAITKINNRIDRDYLYYLILSPSSQAYFLNNAAGSGVQNLNADIIKSLPVSTPKLPEQLKIADCLSSIDELIDAQEQKLTTLKTHRKGLMQQLFPSINETDR